MTWPSSARGRPSLTLLAARIRADCVSQTIHLLLFCQGELKLQNTSHCADIELQNIFPSNFTPSPCHRFVKLLEDRHALLRNYSTALSQRPSSFTDSSRVAQNIDGLFEKAGVTKLLNCHGSFATASCIKCKRRFDGKEIEPDVFESRIPLCPDCHAAIELVYKEFLAKRMRGKKKKKKGNGGWQEEDSDDERQVELEHRKELADGGIVKPDIVFFGEKLSDEFDQCLLADREKIDLLLVVGTSLSVSDNFAEPPELSC